MPQAAAQLCSGDGGPCSAGCCFIFTDPPPSNPSATCANICTGTGCHPNYPDCCVTLGGACNASTPYCCAGNGNRNRFCVDGVCDNILNDAFDAVVTGYAAAVPVIGNTNADTLRNGAVHTLRAYGPVASGGLPAVNLANLDPLGDLTLGNGIDALTNALPGLSFTGNTPDDTTLGAFTGFAKRLIGLADTRPTLIVDGINNILPTLHTGLATILAVNLANVGDDAINTIGDVDNIHLGDLNRIAAASGLRDITVRDAAALYGVTSASDLGNLDLATITSVTDMIATAAAGALGSLRGSNSCSTSANCCNDGNCSCCAHVGAGGGSCCGSVAAASTGFGAIFGVTTNDICDDNDICPCASAGVTCTRNSDCCNGRCCNGGGNGNCNGNCANGSGHNCGCDKKSAT